MNNLSKVRTFSTFKWAFSNLAKNNLNPVKTATTRILNPGKSGVWCPGGFLGTTHINHRFYGKKACYELKNGQNKSNDLDEENNSVVEAQDVLIEYLHSTRSLQYSDAENISRNSPEFLEKLLKDVENEKDVKQSLRRLLCYHPINEFEPFFESMGLKPCEYASLLPRDMIYLVDDQRLLSNYHVLCEYGVSPDKVGRIYMGARDVFRYDHGRLLAVLEFFEAKGFSQPSVVKLVMSCPDILVIKDFMKVLEMLMNAGIVNSWFEENILEENTYSWSRILETLYLIKKFGLSNEDIRELLNKNPMVLMEDSGAKTISLVVFLIKFGASVDNKLSMFKQFPQIKIQTFLSNLKKSYDFLLAIEMDADDAANIIRTNPAVLGSCTLKTVRSLLNSLNCGKKRLCDTIKENPQELKNWVLGKKVKALPNAKNEMSQKKIRFLMDLGFVENSSEMTKALKLFRGNGGELQERFDCLVNAGLSRENVTEMVRLAPQVINQTKEVIEMKLDFFVNELGYNVSSLVTFPAFLAHSIQKIKLRFAMYNWLVGRGKVNGNLALSTIIASSDKIFLQGKVDLDPECLYAWNNFKKKFFPE
uniref:transcription termination factor MTEF18, mitochondrial-like n=1 Tax=Erigeron canadensis TaxID=72917 RepID=UPI001CB89A57|nr:transcription termination factor MTEF18, mitochondrial-like [Erigeron canadensis]